MGLISNKRGLQTGVSSKTFSNRHKGNISPKRKFRYFRSRGGRLIKKRCNRGSSTSRNKFRFLQHLFPCSQKEWENETRHKSETPKRLSPEDSLQNGHICKSFKLSETKRLGNISRSQRCLPTYSNFCETSEISPILHKQKVLSVQIPVLRTNLCASRVHKNNSSYCSSFKGAKYKTGIISRRLVSAESDKSIAVTRSREMPQSVDFTRLHSQYRKIHSKTDSENNIHRGSVSTGPRISVSNSRKSKQVTFCCEQHSNKSSNSPRFSASFGANVFVPGTDSQCSSIHEANSVASSLFLETEQYEFGSQNSCYSTSEISSEMVVGFSKHFEGQIFTTLSNKYNHNDRCFEFWIWRACDESVRSGYMVSSSEEVAYQFSGVGSSVPDFETFSSYTGGSECTDTIGQYDSSTVHQQTGGHTFTSAMLQDLGSVELGDPEQYSDQSSPYFRETQCLGRSAEQEQSVTHGMDFEQISSTEAVPSVGLAFDRSVCFSRESTDSDILFLVTSSSSIGTRRAINLVGEHVCVCISPNLSHSQSSSAYETFSVPGYPDSSTVAQETLVHRPSSTSSGLSKKTSNSVKSITSAKKQDKSPKSRGVQLDCLASLNRNFKEKGFSKQARQLLTASWRKGTQKDYTSKFKKFCSWCHTRQIDPNSASLIQVADFLSGLFNSGLQHRTIAGYRSMLSSVLSPINNVPVGQHPHIIRLLKGVFNSRPPKVKLLPEWDLQLVLNMLQNKPFEPLSQASLKLITYKTVFLMAICTFRRCSDLQSLKLGEGSVCVQKKGITFIRHGLSKQDRQKHFGSKIFVPAFTENAKLDPKRALYFYLKKTVSLRTKTDGSSEDKLFLAVREPHHPISSQTISKWLVKTIRMAYNDNSMKVKAHSTRAIGPSWALFNGASMRSILEAADWSKESTFIQFYFRNVDVEVLKQ